MTNRAALTIGYWSLAIRACAQPLCLSSYRVGFVNLYGGRVQTLGASPTRGSILRSMDGRPIRVVM